MRSGTSLSTILILAMSFVLAIWLGVSLVTDQLQTILYAAGGTLLLTSILLGQRIWLLMIFMSAANIVLLRGFGTTDIGQALFLAFTIILLCLRKLRTSWSFGELELWGLLVILMVVQVYIRNPVGLSALGGSTVGARPYLVMALALPTAFFLANYKVDPNELKWAMRLSILGILIGIPANVLRQGIATSEEGLYRIPFLNVLGTLISRVVVSYISPLRAILHPIWGVVVLVSVFAAAGSGYRNAIAMVGLIYLFGIAYRSGLPGLFGSVFAGIMGIAVLAMVNSAIPLPRNVQRALSFLPGTWDRSQVQAGSTSTEWRMEMWKEALTSERWIKNKIIGDGLGMTAEALESNMMLDATTVGYAASGLLVQQENMLINGSYHSGPVHTIRAVGYVGLVILLIAMVRVAVHAHRQIMRCRGTEWMPMAMFFCVPILVNPVFFVFVFGEFQTGVATTFLGAAMVRLLEKNLPLPVYVATRPQPFVPLAVRNMNLARQSS